MLLRRTRHHLQVVQLRSCAMRWFALGWRRARETGKHPKRRHKLLAIRQSGCCAVAAACRPGCSSPQLLPLILRHRDSAWGSQSHPAALPPPPPTACSANRSSTGTCAVQTATHSRDGSPNPQARGWMAIIRLPMHSSQQAYVSGHYRSASGRWSPSRSRSAAGRCKTATWAAHSKMAD